MLEEDTILYIRFHSSARASIMLSLYISIKSMLMMTTCSISPLRAHQQKPSSTLSSSSSAAVDSHQLTSAYSLLLRLHIIYTWRDETLSLSVDGQFQFITRH